MKRQLRRNEAGEDEREEFLLGLATLCHAMSAEATNSFLTRLINSPTLIESVIALTNALRSAPVEVLQSTTDGDINRIASRVGRFDRFTRLLRCRAACLQTWSLMGDETSLIDQLERRSEALGVRTQPPAPIILGRHLIALGEKPGLHFRSLLSEIFDHQLDGRFGTEAEGTEFAREVVQRARGMPT